MGLKTPHYIMYISMTTATTNDYTAHNLGLKTKAQLCSFYVDKLGFQVGSNSYREHRTIKNLMCKKKADIIKFIMNEMEHPIKLPSAREKGLDHIINMIQERKNQELLIKELKEEVVLMRNDKDAMELEFLLEIKELKQLLAENTFVDCEEPE